ncbi:platelet glycoprotein V-like [Tenebrio molitor]|jgi:Leucine-rich repeat (LRR) protein|uniref:platelet glycoprotein V-like n=1 Tax=Tenebrio molitor TaxID=7067 RepID=UPI003624717B
MIVILNFCVLSTILVGVLDACSESLVYDENEIVETTTSRDEYNEYDENTLTIPSKGKVLYGTITCYYIFSLEQFNYSYQDKPYDQYLKIENSTLPTLKQSAFVRFSTITKLYLSSLGIETILPGAFNGLTAIKELYLDHNELSELSKGVYNSLHRLEVLTLNDNKIQKIESLAFMGADNLVELCLRNNKITTIEDEMLKTQKRMKYLDLSGNPLVQFSLKGLSHVDTLNVNSTQLSEIDEDLSSLRVKWMDLSSSQFTTVNFSTFPKLDELYLSHNQIESLANCQVLEAIDVRLDNNRIKTINETFRDISRFYIRHNELEVLRDSLFNKSKSLLVADFGFNKISTVEKFAFRNLTSLDLLDLQHNAISRIDPVLFRDLHHLTLLDLSNNLITEFQYGTFDSLSNLRILNISDNRLVSLHQYTFGSLLNLRNLHFDNNQISTVNVDDLTYHLPSLRVVSLDNNPWRCKDLVIVRNSFRKSKVVISSGESYDVENFHGIACQNDNSVSTVTPDSKIERFFNEDFGNSTFYRYFDKDFAHSRFFKFFESFHDTEHLNETQMEKFTAVDVAPNKYDNNVLVFSTVVQVLILAVMLFGFYFMVDFLKKVNHSKQLETMSQTEVC